jgi:hypothetical protein
MTSGWTPTSRGEGRLPKNWNCQLRARCKTQEEDINSVNSDIMQLEDKLRLRASRAGSRRLTDSLSECNAVKKTKQMDLLTEVHIY